MNTIGIIRKIDDLGRIVIPKEMRKIIHVLEGDLVEIILTDEGVLVKKYNNNSIAEAVKKLKEVAIKNEMELNVFEKIKDLEEILQTQTLEGQV